MQDPFRRYQSWDEVPEKTVKKRTAPKKASRSLKKKKPSQKPMFSKSASIAIVFFCGLGLVASGSVLIFPDFDWSQISKLKIQIPTSFAGDDDEKKINAKGGAPEREPASEMLNSESAKLSMENTSIHDALEKKRLELEERERELGRLAENLQEKEKEIDKQLKEMVGLRREISSKLDEKVVANQKSLDKLVSVYANMKPANAAQILTTIDESLAVKVLGKMKKQNAAAILNYISPKKARILSEKYAGLKK